MAACLEMNPQVRGLMAGSWWFDPRMEKITPILKKMGDLMLGNGALLFRYGPDSSSLKNALANSPARQKLYDQRQYFPETHFVVWPRDSLTEWAGRPAGN